MGISLAAETHIMESDRIPEGRKDVHEFLELCRMHVYHCVYAKPHKPVSICPPVELLHNSVIYI